MSSNSASATSPAPGVPETSESAEPPESTEEPYPHQHTTQYWEKWRGVFTGIVRRGLEGMVLLVAIQYFHAGEFHKAWLAAAVSVGQLLSPLSVYLAARLGLPVARALALLFAASGVALLISALFENLHLYFAGVMLSVPLISMSATLVTELWRQNVPDLKRGFLFSSVSERGSLGGLAATVLMAVWIGGQLERYRAVFAVIALCLFGAAYCFARIPSRALERPRRHPWAGLAWLWKDRTFGYVCATWMLMGIANLAILPLRMEYVANEDKSVGLGYDAWIVLLLIQIVPGLVRFISAHFWGRMFDNANFIVLRIVLNLLFAFNMLLFFQDQFWVQILAAVCFGLGEGGGEIAWSLWVTKFSPPNRTAEYMGVHVFLTGLRGVIAPQIVYSLLAPLGMRTITYVTMGMILVASAMLLPLLSMGRRMAAEQNALRSASENPVPGP